MKLKIDSSGKSTALFIKNKIPIISTKNLSFLRKKKQNIRFCLHKSKKSKLHCMVNLILKKNGINTHKHNKDESYCLLEGKLLISVMIKKKIKKIKLENKKNRIAFIPKNIFHSIRSITPYSIFFETSIGPFTKKNTIYEKN